MKLSMDAVQMGKVVRQKVGIMAKIARIAIIRTSGMVASVIAASAAIAVITAIASITGIASIIASTQAQADLLFSLESTSPLQEEAEDPSIAFIRPNEINLENQLEILRNASPGALITVGTDRGDFTASMAPQITKVVKIDRSAYVVRYNRIQRALFSISRDHRHFKELRGTKKFSDWERFNPHRWQSDLDKENFQWWRLMIQNRRIDLDRRDRREEFRFDFLEDASLYDRVAQLAKADQSRVLQINLRDLDAFEDILKRIKSEGNEISIIDLSNTWWTSYLGVHGIAKLIERAKPYTNANTIWLFSYMYKGFFSNYFSFTSAEFQKQKAAFHRLALVVNTSYSLVLDKLPPVQGNNPDLSQWVPDEEVTRLPGDCQSLLTGREIDSLRRRIQILK